ncbi:unnamed protein product [Mesocestoides corti]|uniref:Protein DPCD n=1 Tax=Mesocestoides corti TaxID=53468 RepID=A0A0R3UH91_MESCO|nr:unnamed protein product [Mesocestoides corti]
MVEQYDNLSETIVERKWKAPTQLGGEGPWVYEIGQQQETCSSVLEEFKESNANPVFCRCDTKQDFQWRIRNLPYPIETYQLSIDDDNSTITLRTTNKKKPPAYYQYEKELRKELLKTKPISGGDMPCASM